MKKNKLTSILNSFFDSWKQEYNYIIKDSAVWFTFIVTSLAVAFAYTYIYSKQVLEDIPIAVVDNNQSPQSRMLTRMLDATSQVKITHGVANFEDAKELFYKQKVNGIVLIPSDFSKNILQSKNTSVSFYCDASYLLYYRQTLTAAKKTLAYLNAGIKIKKLSAKGKSLEQAMNISVPTRPVITSLYNPATGYGTFVMPAVYLVIIQSLLLTGIGILVGTFRERNKNNLKLLKKVNNFSPMGLLMGKAAAYTTVGYLLFIIILGFVYSLFDIPHHGNIFDLLFFFSPFILSISFMGLSFIAFLRHREDAVMSLLFLSIPSLLVSGITWPAEGMPEIIKTISLIFPSTLAIKGFININQAGAHIWEMKELWIKMWILCFIYMGLAMANFKYVLNSMRKNIENR